MPMTSGCNGSIAASAAWISVPGSMRPVSSMVTCSCNGTSRPNSAIAAASLDRGLDAEQVELCLDQEQVDATVEQAEALVVIGVGQFVVGDLAERRELGARTDRAGDPDAVLVGDGAGDGGVGARDLAIAIGEAVFAERHRERTEGVGLDDVDAELAVGAMETLDHVGSGDAEYLVAALELWTAEVVGGQVLLLEPGARRSVVDDDATASGFDVGLGVTGAVHAPSRLPVRGGPTTAN